MSKREREREVSRMRDDGRGRIGERTTRPAHRAMLLGDSRNSAFT